MELDIFFPSNQSRECKFAYFFVETNANGFREAVRQLVPAFDDPEICIQETGQQEDAKIGKCLGNLGIDSVDTRDNLVSGIEPTSVSEDENRCHPGKLA